MALYQRGSIDREVKRIQRKLQGKNDYSCSIVEVVGRFDFIVIVGSGRKYENPLPPEEKVLWLTLESHPN